MRSVTVREPEYRAEDLPALRALIHEPARGPHGYLLSDALSDDVDPKSWDSTHRVVVPLPRRDHYQTALNQAQEEYRKKYPHEDISSLMWRVERVPK